MRRFFFILLIMPLSILAQKTSYGFVSIDQKQTIIGKYTRIVKDTICGDCVVDYKKGNIPTKYLWVEYNIFEPPGYLEIMKWYWNGFPKTYNGWKLEIESVAYIHGFTEGVKLERLNATCDTCDYLDKYSYDISLSYGYSDEAKLTVTQNKDTTNKYFKRQFP